MDPDAVAKAFVQHCYSTFDSNRAGLANLYQEQSMLTFEGEKILGSHNIVTKLTNLPFQQCQHSIGTVDCQPSGPSNGVLVFVSGHLQLAGEQHALKFSQKEKRMIPAHLIAEAMSTLRGLDLRWSGPITQHEMQFVEQYVLAKYPQYINGLVDGEIQLPNSDSPSEPSYPSPDNTDNPKTFGSSPSFSRSFSDLDQTQLEPSRLLEMLTKKSSPQGNFVSIPEIQARNRALRHLGLKEDEYVVLFVTCYKEAMVMVGESYPFCKGSYYMTIIEEEDDKIRDFAASKESKIVAAPETWLDLRIKGSQLSQYFRKKCKNVPKGLFSYPAVAGGTRHSMHWISEAHRNSWHVLVDATGMVVGEDHLALTLHRPDFVVCAIGKSRGQPAEITCLLVRRRSFDVLA